jgi:hypothetical protein
VEVEHEEHLRRPAADAADLRQVRDDLLVLPLPEVLDAQLARGEVLRKAADGGGLLPREAHCAQVLVAQREHLGGRGEWRRQRRPVGVGPAHGAIEPVAAFEQRQEPAEDGAGRLPAELLVDDCPRQRPERVLPIAPHPEFPRAVDERAHHGVRAAQVRECRLGIDASHVVVSVNARGCAW